MCRRWRYCQVSRAKGETGSCLYVLSFNHLVFKLSRLVEGPRTGAKLIPKSLKYSILFKRIMKKCKK